MFTMFETFEINKEDLSDKERLILDTAVKIFAEKGFDKTTTKEIAREAGIAEGTIFRYFKTKNDLLTGIMGELIKIVTQNFAFKSIEKIVKNYEDKTPHIILKEIIKDRIELIEKIQKAIPMIKTIGIQSMLNNDLREIFFENVIKKALELFENVFSYFREKKLIRDDIYIDTIARIIVGNVMLLIIQKNFFSGKLRDFETEQEIDVIVELIMNGIGPKK